jgi:hypothetical protein
MVEQALFPLASKGSLQLIASLPHKCQRPLAIENFFRRLVILQVPHKPFFRSDKVDGHCNITRRRPSGRHRRRRCHCRSVACVGIPKELRPQRPCAASTGEAADENPDPGSYHLIVERVYIARHCFDLCGRVVVVGAMNSNFASSRLRH